MYRSRVIPCLLLHNGGLYKTVQFADPIYIGDPINAVKIFNEKEVDELILLDIDATAQQREPDYPLLQDIASECFIPLSYGGGVTSIDQFQRLFELGIEKVSISSSALADPGLIQKSAQRFGSQSIIVTIDLKTPRFSRSYHVVTHNGKRKHRITPLDAAMLAQRNGAGEIVLNFADRDGKMCGYDVATVRNISSAIDIPLIALGGAGSIHDLQAVIKEGGASAAAAGSLFVYQGVHRAVLINYPSQAELRDLQEE